jgi:nucleoside-diphosphate-sugar epimerase
MIPTVRVMVTGGTGFIGGHVVRALLDAGHEPRLLVRDAEKVERLCALHGLDPAAISFVLGDILNPTSVREALSGCSACIHAAAFTSLSPEEMPKALEINGPGARIVLDEAVRAGCDPIVHISSSSVVFPPTGDRQSAYDPVGDSEAPYTASKEEADRYARELQAAGRPVVIIYPAAVVGPLDLGVNVLEGIMAGAMAADFVMTADRGGWLLVDVRDLATAITRLIESGRGPRRYMAGGNFLSFDEFADALQTVTGVERNRVHMSEADLLQVLDEEAVRLMLGAVPADNDALLVDTGTVWRPFDETLADLQKWLQIRNKV